MLKLISKLKRILKKEIGISYFKIYYYQVLIFFLILFFYFFTRVYHLTILPVFCDEAIYIRWSQVMRNEPTLRFLPLSDGKQPLFMWLTMPFLKVFSDPLFAGRLVSVLAGLISFLGIAALSFFLFSSIRISLVASFIYVIAPYFLVFDRMALVDSLLSMFGIWSLFFALLLGVFQRLDLAMILGFFLGGGMLTKSPGLLFLLMILPVVFLSFKSNFQKVKLQFGTRILFKKVPLVLISWFIALSIYSILKLGPNFQMISIRNKDYIFPFSEILKYPLFPLLNNLKSAFSFYWRYLTPAGLFFGLWGLFLGIMRFQRKKDYKLLAIIFWWIIPILGQSFLAKTVTSRYLLYTALPFILFISYGFENIGSRLRKLNLILFGFLILIFFAPALNFDWRLLNNPKSVFFAREDLGYVEGWTSGWGIKEAADYLVSLPKESKIVVATEGYFGTLPDGLQIYLEGEKNITVLGIGWPLKTIPENILDARKSGNIVYLLVNKSRIEILETTRLNLLKEFQKPGGDNLLFYQVLD